MLKYDNISYMPKKSPKKRKSSKRRKSPRKKIDYIDQIDTFLNNIDTTNIEYSFKL